MSVRQDTVDRDTRHTERTTLQLVAMLFSAAFVLVGIAGFIPGITEDAPGSFWGEDSEGSLLGVFQTSILHNLVHLAIGIVGFLFSRTPGGARTFLIGGGIAYLALWVIGLLGSMDWLPADDTDDWLHLALGAPMLALGFLLSDRRRDDVRTDDVRRDEVRTNEVRDTEPRV